MRLLLAFSFLILTLTAFGQTRALDKGCGDYRKLGKAVEVLELMEQGKVKEVYSHLSGKIKIDLSELETHIREISEIYPYIEGSTPPSFIIDKSSSLWYTRTYYMPTEIGVEYQQQIHLKLIEDHGSLIISQIEFRRNGQIELIEKEIAEMERVDGNNPPPPPAPPGF